MEEKVSVWKANLTGGVILGLAGIVYSLIMYFLDLTFNPIQPWIFLVLEFFILVYLLRSYRDNYLHGNMTYGQALGAGVIIFLYTSIISAIFVYILYSVIDTGLMDKQLAFTEGKMLERGMTQAQVDMSMQIQRKIMIPEILAPISIISSMFGGFIMSLIAAAFARKEGNPLIDTPEQN